MTIRRETEITASGSKTTTVWDPADTIVKVARGATENFVTLWSAPFKALGSIAIWALTRGGEAVKIDQERERSQ